MKGLKRLWKRSEMSWVGCVLIVIGDVDEDVSVGEGLLHLGVEGFGVLLEG